MTIKTVNQVSTTNWWPYTDEEWEQLNYPERFNQPQKPVDKEDKK